MKALIRLAESGAFLPRLLTPLISAELFSNAWTSGLRHSVIWVRRSVRHQGQADAQPRQRPDRAAIAPRYEDRIATALSTSTRPMEEEPFPSHALTARRACRMRPGGIAGIVTLRRHRHGSGSDPVRPFRRARGSRRRRRSPASVTCALASTTSASDGRRLVVAAGPLTWERPVIARVLGGRLP